ncbi:aconitase X swivel domain-containing protein [Humibacillus sp. DSM 29435]|uniref:aconitase X swivel domain-containing protein n=1 Tax=Humibacillus sp. DSM 29435 TaxID=1869167 RepID=UPI0020C79C47|nr:DUF126 domain-containing protein [Humibacillus sp. DSM 29435]
MTTSSADAASRMPLSAVPLHAGHASGTVLHLDTPLSFWGGTDHHGTIIDAHHPQRGQSVTGRVLVMRAGRGSSSSSYVLAEQLRQQCGPAAIVLAERDAIVVLGAIVARELYGSDMPVALVTAEELAELPTGLAVTVDCSTDHGSVTLPD